MSCAAQAIGAGLIGEVQTVSLNLNSDNLQVVHATDDVTQLFPIRQMIVTEWV
jgi:hypothetical protein